MKSNKTFEFERFKALSEVSELCAYMEPILYDANVVVDEITLGRILSELPRFDEYHLVYALHLGAFRNPDLFAPVVPKYLSHPEGSVWCAATRILGALPGYCITSTLIDAVRDALPRCPGQELFPDLLDELEKRRKQNS